MGPVHLDSDLVLGDGDVDHVVGISVLLNRRNAQPLEG